MHERKKTSAWADVGFFLTKLLVLGAIFAFGWKFMPTWIPYIQLSALIIFLIVALVVLYPKMALPLIDAIGDKIRGYDDKASPKPPSSPPEVGP